MARLRACSYGGRLCRASAQNGEDHAKSVHGNLGVAVKRMTFRGWEHFFFATWWDSLEAIKAFAGENYQLAVHYPDDERFELVQILMCSTTR